MQDPLSQGDVLPVMMLFCYTSIYTSVRSVAIDLLERATVYYPLYGRTLRDRLMFFCFLSSKKKKKSIYILPSLKIDTASKARKQVVAQELATFNA